MELFCELGPRHAFVYSMVEPYSTVYELEIITALPRPTVLSVLESLLAHRYLVRHAELGKSYSKASAAGANNESVL